MNVRHFAVNKLAHQNLGALTNGLRCVEYHAPFGVPPPTTSNGSVCDRLGKVWNRTTRRLEHDSMTPHKSDRFPGTHFQLSFVPGDSKRSSKGISPGMFVNFKYARGIMPLLIQAMTLAHEDDLACYASLPEQLVRLSCLDKRKSLCDLCVFHSVMPTTPKTAAATHAR